MQYGLSEKTLNILNTIFCKYPGIKQVVLYGTKGNFKNGSDIDLSLKVDESFTRSDLLNIIGDFDDSDLPYFVDICIYNNISNPDLKSHIDRVGKVIALRY